MHCALLLHVAMQFGLSHLFMMKSPAYSLWGFRSGLIGLSCWLSAPLGLSLPSATASTGGFSEFPAYSQVYLRNYNIWSWDTLLSRLLSLL